MSYQVLARKWRPKNFEQLMGQDHVVTVLVNALRQQRLHHAYLFTGTRGVGKTTIARIFAKSLNCELGITATPCGQCDACQDIDQGRFVDLLEIDAASKTKVDDTREILDNVQYAPSRGRYKVYLIDEVHMLSRSSFNALLKTLEEPPEHVKFILATTDPQKLPVTVLSRCLQFHLKALTVGQIEQKLQQILQAEQVSHEAGALTLLAKAARGSMRDSLSLTDQAIAQGHDNISISNVQQMLGGVDVNWPYKILIALIKQDAPSLMALSLEIASYSPSYNRLLAELLQLLHQIAMAQVVDGHFDLAPEHVALLAKFAKAMSPEDVQLYYQICLNGRKDLPYAADEQAAFDMVMLRLLAFKPMHKPLESQVDHNRNNKVLDTNSAADMDFSQESLSATNVNMPPISTADPLQANHNADNTELAELAIESVEAIELQHPEEHQAVVTPDSLTKEMFAIEQSALAQGYQPAELPLAAKPVPVEEQVHEPANEQTEARQQLQKENVGADATPANAAEPTFSQAVFTSDIDAALATRNMLRSRKNKLEQSAKKSGDALLRHPHGQTVGADITAKAEIPAGNADNKATVNASDANSDQHQDPDIPPIATLLQQRFSPDIIDPAIVRKANQVDKWANMIDTMALGGRLRQLAIHATIDGNSTDEHLILNLDQSSKHLSNDNANQQLATNLSQLLSRHVNVDINIVEQTIAAPFEIQSHINDKRYDYARSLLEQDELVQQLQQQFQASIDVDSIKAR